MNVAGPVANLPPTLTATTVRIGSPRLLQSWLNGPGRWAGWLFLAVVPVFIGATTLVLMSSEQCHIGQNPNARSLWDRDLYDDGCLMGHGFTMDVISFVLVVAALFLLATGFAALRRDRALLDPVDASNRLQGIKDWFIRGDIDEADYERLRRLLGTGGETAGPATAHKARSFLRAFAVLTLPLGVFWFFFVMVFSFEVLAPFSGGSDGPVFSAIISLIAGSLLLVALMVAALIRASFITRFLGAQRQEALRHVDAVETQVMRNARARVGAGTMATPVGAGASFRPYARR